MRYPLLADIVNMGTYEYIIYSVIYVQLQYIWHFQGGTKGGTSRGYIKARYHKWVLKVLKEQLRV